MGGDGAETTEPIAAMLRLALGYLRAAAPSPLTREYRTKAESYRLAIERWKMSPPSGEQMAALGDLVKELHAAVLSSARRGSLRALVRASGGES